jgi:uncharacterized membrane protein HdeD (DUF308 family)
MQSSLVRSLCAIIVGALLVKYREQTVTWMTIAIGVLFFLSGVVSCAAYFAARRNSEMPQVFDANGKQLTGLKPQFPIVGLGSLILGLILALMPTVFVNFLMYILAAILILGAVSQFVNLATVSRIARIGFYFWVMPSLILLIGIIAVLYPQSIASAPLFVIGWCLILYGVVECVNAVKIHKLRKQFEAMQQMVQQETETEE